MVGRDAFLLEKLMPWLDAGRIGIYWFLGAVAALLAALIYWDVDW